MSFHLREHYINLFLIILQSMSILLKKDHSPLKFDTSSANLNCFIRPNSKLKHTDSDHYPKNYKHKKRSRNEHHKHIEFLDKAFLESVVSKILTDADCQGITELIDNMVFPSTNSADAEANKDTRRQQLQQQEISQIFSDFCSLTRPNYPPKVNIYDHNNELYRILPPQLYQYSQNGHLKYEDKQEITTTLHTSYANSYCVSPRGGDTNPEREMLNNMNQLMSMGYPYGYYTQPNCLYQRPLSQRKRRAVSGQQVQQFRIIPNQIQADGRTTLMIRHIPNKYSQEMLLEQIGKNHRLHINLLYLPIDNYNFCNVGYAFVNFIHTKFIYEFYRQFNGRRWDRFNSQKICELAYARIQGTTNLMDHFQNTSNGQLRGRTLSKCEERKKSAVELDEDAINGIRQIVNHQRVEEN